MSGSLPTLQDRRASAFDTIINRLKAANIPTSGLDKHDIIDDSIIVYLRYVGMTNNYLGSKRQSADKIS
jgi:hypothetical protein